MLFFLGVDSLNSFALPPQSAAFLRNFSSAGTLELTTTDLVQSPLFMPRFFFFRQNFVRQPLFLALVLRSYARRNFLGPVFFAANFLFLLCHFLVEKRHRPISHHVQNAHHRAFNFPCCDPNDYCCLDKSVIQFSMAFSHELRWQINDLINLTIIVLTDHYSGNSFMCAIFGHDLFPIFGSNLQPLKTQKTHKNPICSKKKSMKNNTYIFRIQINSSSIIEKSFQKRT